MIKISKLKLNEVSKDRSEGYLEEVMSYAVGFDDLNVFLKSPDYDFLQKKYSPLEFDKRLQFFKKLCGGPGMELKKILAKWPWKIVATKNCSCNARAKTMDSKERQEPGWCIKNIDTIVGWLREEANKRRLPFINFVGKLLVKKAISNHNKLKSR